MNLENSNLTDTFYNDNGNRSLLNSGESLFTVLPQLHTPVRQAPIRIAIRAQRKILLINPANVIAIVAEGNYVLVQQESTSNLLRESISTIEEELKQHGFVRIHRSVLINAACVEEIQPWSTGEYILRARGREYTVTRTYRKNLRLLAQLWIGTAAFFAE
jgi:DNA-binding LytR/AlgR family response regulator